MRKKMKELLHKEEGFTLVELLAVIVILGIIVAIAVPAIGNVISDSRTRASDAEEELVIDAARLYIVNEEEIPENNQITVEILKETGYLEETTSGNIEDSDYVTVTKVPDTNNYRYTFGDPAPETP